MSLQPNPRSDPASTARLKLTTTGVEDGPTGGDRLTNTSFVQRLSTR